MAWRDNLLPASFRGASFHVEDNTRQGGRRVVGHQFPKRDEPYSEDMGRRGRRVTVAAYVLGDNYTALRDALCDAMEKEGAGLLVLPTRGQELMAPETYSVRESRLRGGIAEVELTFVEPGSQEQAATASTASAVDSAASQVESSSSTGIDKAIPAAPGTVST